MRIVFMGTPDFAAASLERLYSEGYDIAGVYTQPDKARNRGKRVSFSAVKEVALARGTSVFQPVSLRDENAISELRGLDCGLIVVVAYGKLLPREMLSIPPYGCINIHASLLPKYRGAAPVQWAVLNGESETGVTAQYMAEDVDAGEVILSKSTMIGDNETAESLFGRLSVLGAELLSETVSAIERGDAASVPQNNLEATYAPMLSKDMSLIDWSKTAWQIKCAVRGLTPWPIATAMINGTLCKIYSVEIVSNDSDKKPGEIISAQQSGASDAARIIVACSDAAILIKELQAPGGKRMSAAEYLRGHPITV